MFRYHSFCNLSIKTRSNSSFSNLFVDQKLKPCFYHLLNIQRRVFAQLLIVGLEREMMGLEHVYGEIKELAALSRNGTFELFQT